MGKLKKKSKKSSKKSAVARVAESALSAVYSAPSSKARSGGRRSRMTPERLARQILILKLKRKLFRLKYGGR